MIGFMLVGLPVLAEDYMYTPEEWYELTGENPYADEENPNGTQELTSIPYVFEVDEEGGDEQLREAGESGFDRPGAVGIDISESGVYLDGDGSYAVEIPEVPPPTPVEEE